MTALPHPTGVWGDVNCAGLPPEMDRFPFMDTLDAPITFVSLCCFFGCYLACCQTHLRQLRQHSHDLLALRRQYPSGYCGKKSPDGTPTDTATEPLETMKQMYCESVLRSGLRHFCAQCWMRIRLGNGAHLVQFPLRLLHCPPWLRQETCSAVERCWRCRAKMWCECGLSWVPVIHRGR